MDLGKHADLPSILHSIDGFAGPKLQVPHHLSLLGV